MNAPTDKPKRDEQESSRFLVLLASSTREKLEQYQTIAREKNLPIEFHMLTEVAPYFHSAAEDTGDRDKNAEQKLNEIKPILRACRKEGSPQNKALEHKCEVWGIPFKAENIYFATDDSTFTVPSDVWKFLRPKLEKFVDRNLLEPKKKPKIKKGAEEPREAGPGAELGPILGAAGTARFFKRLREASDEAGYGDAPVGLTQRITMLLACLDGNENDKAIKQEAKTQVFLHTPHGGRSPEDPVAITKSEDFIRANGHNIALADYWKEYLASRHERNEIVEKLKTRVFKINGATSRNQPDAPPAYEPERKFTIGLPTTRDLSDGFAVRLRKELKAPVEFPLGLYHGGNPDDSDHEKVRNALSMEHVMSQSDGLIFTPFDRSTIRPEERTANYLSLFSVKVAKQLIARDMPKPVVVMDLNKCWQKAVDFGFDLVNKGMSKDYDREAYEPSPLPKLPHGVTHYATSYFDVVSGDNAEDLKKAAIAVMDHRRKQYIPFVSGEAMHMPPDQFISKGEAPPEDMFKVAVFVSASNDNKRLLKDMRTLGYDLADSEFGLIWGGGDRHAMGAVYEGYRDYKPKEGKKKWMGAFSTKPIYRSETEHGVAPKGVNYWEENEDIYQRMAHMIHKEADPKRKGDFNLDANAIVIAPGGDGTAQEWLAVLQLKHAFPELMKNKSLIIYTPDLHSEGRKEAREKPFWEKGIKTVMGKSFYNRITENHDAYEKDGVYLATDKEEVMTLLARLHEKELSHVGQLAASRTPGGITRH